MNPLAWFSLYYTVVVALGVVCVWLVARGNNRDTWDYLRRHLSALQIAKLMVMSAIWPLLLADVVVQTIVEAYRRSA